MCEISEMVKEMAEYFHKAGVLYNNELSAPEIDSWRLLGRDIDNYVLYKIRI